MSECLSRCTEISFLRASGKRGAQFFNIIKKKIPDLGTVKNIQANSQRYYNQTHNYCFHNDTIFILTFASVFWGYLILSQGWHVGKYSIDLTPAPLSGQTEERKN
jgi:hypothetical protein